jgi:hypothetical protein
MRSRAVAIGAQEPEHFFIAERLEVFGGWPRELSHPTNIAFDGSALFVPNLGRWHVTRIASDTNAPPL